MGNKFREMFKQDSESNKQMLKHIEEHIQKSTEEKSCPSCRYSDLIDDGQGYSHYECRLRKKTTDILKVDEDCIYHRTKTNFIIKDYDRKAIIDVFLKRLDEEIEALNTNIEVYDAPETRAKYQIMLQQTKDIKNTLLYLMGESKNEK